MQELTVKLLKSSSARNQPSPSQSTCTNLGVELIIRSERGCLVARHLRRFDPPVLLVSLHLGVLFLLACLFVFPSDEGTRLPAGLRDLIHIHACRQRNQKSCSSYTMSTRKAPTFGCLSIVYLCMLPHRALENVDQR